jgi:hypothetical protein
VVLLALASAFAGSCATLVVTAPFQYLGHIQRRLADDGDAIRSWQPEKVLGVRRRPLEPAGAGRLHTAFNASTAEGSPLGWAVLDKMGREVKVIDPRGEEVRTVGRAGQGPGELDRPGKAIVRADGTVAVADAMSRHIDVFPTIGDPYRVPVDRGRCLSASTQRLWSLGDDTWILLRRCMIGVDIHSQLVEITGSGATVHHPKRPLSQATIDPFARPLAIMEEGRVLVGSTRELCLRGGRDEEGSARCLPSAPPPTIPDSVRDDFFGDLPAKAALIGVKLETPDEMPGIMNVRETSRGPALRVVLEDLSEAWAFEEGGELVYAELPDGLRAYPGWDAWLLLADELDGLRIWTVPYTDWTDGD